MLIWTVCFGASVVFCCIFAKRLGQWLDVIGRQDVGRLRIRGYGGGPVRCGRPWSVRVRSDAFRFGPGRMVVNATMQWCTVLHCGEERARRTVRIR